MMNEKMVQMKSDDALIKLNKAIETVLQAYLPAEFKSIRFDMFDKDHQPSDPTICVFLYDIQEDLELRHGQGRHYDPMDGKFAPRKVHIRCCYLLTYWEKASEGQITGSAQHLQMMNMALNGLLNMKFPESELPSAYLRVVAPSEHLSSLGNFWQSLGDKPRLCLTFNVTIPIQLGLSNKEEAHPVLNVQLAPSLSETNSKDGVQDFSRLLLEKTISIAAVDKDADLNGLRAQLSWLKVTPDPAGKDKLTLEGIVDKACNKIIVKALGEIKAYTVANKLQVLDEGSRS